MLDVAIEGYQTSPQQKRLWSLQRAGGRYRAQCVIAIDGVLDVARLRAALEQAIARHEILRTTFRALPGTTAPAQIIGAPAMHWGEVRRDPSDTIPSEAFLDAVCREQTAIEIDLECGPIVHATLIADVGHRHALVLTLPALNADGHTLGTIVADLVDAYTHAGEREDALQYAQVAEWQNGLASEDDGAGREYWRAHDVPAHVRAMVRGAEGRLAAFEPGCVSTLLSEASFSALIRSAETAGVDPGTFVQACWHVLLWRMHGEQDVLIGRQFDGREEEMLGGVAGPVARWLPISTAIVPGDAIAELARRIARRVEDAIDVQEHFSLEQDGLFFRHGFEAAAWPGPWMAGGTTFTLIRRQARVEPFELLLACGWRQDGLVLDLHYDTAVIDADDARRVLERQVAVLEQAAARGSARLDDLDVLGPRERRRLAVQLNDTAMTVETRCFHEQFARVALEQPGAVAVECGETSLTYAVLDARANQLAHRLRTLGVGPECRVGLLTERSVDAIVGVLGILKAGGAYVPLDSGWPAARVRDVLDQARPDAVVAEGRFVTRLGEWPGRVVAVEDDAREHAAEARGPISSGVTPGNLAYVIYTSGSTGRPKGVMIDHRSLANLIAALRRDIYEQYALGERARVSLNAPLVFDASIKQLVQLAMGHTIVIVPDEARRDGAALAAFAERARIDVLDCTPSQLRMVLEAGPLPRRITLALVGGEAIDRGLWTELSRAGGPPFHNVYGPTECTVDATAASVDGQEPRIGTPIANVRVYVASADLRLAPLGTPGELVIGGAGVGRGYLADASQTAERYVPDPFSGERGARLYRTGDLVRWDSDGRLEFVGRLDAQVKVRGHRIELHEIERLLSGHPAIREAVVHVREDVPGDTRLVAYVVSRGACPAHEDLAAFLRTRLPDSMVPSVFARLEALPLSRNGKVDRSQLPPPDACAPSDGLDPTPRAPTEELLAGIWADVLRIESVGLQDNFFDRGGHSLLVARLVARIRDVFQIDLPLRRVFETPTLGALAEQIDRDVRAGRGVAAPAIEAVGRERPIPLSFPQQRLWFLHQLNPASASYNSPVALRLRGALDTVALIRTFAEVRRRHEILRTTFAMAGGEPVQLIAPPDGRVGLPIADLRAMLPARREAEARRIAREEANTPFDLATGPLLRTRLLTLDHDDHVVLVTTHHIVSDGWSVRVLVEEVAALYTAFSAGRPSPLPGMPLQYADYAHWQRQWLQGETLRTHLSYWSRTLAGAPLVLDLPADRPRPDGPLDRGGRVAFALDEGTSRALRELCRRERVTVFMAWLAAFAALLSDFTGQKDLVIGTDVANRGRREVEGLIGFFVNVLPLRLLVDGQRTFRELLAQTREKALGAYAHQELPFEKLVEELRPARAINRHPVFQVLFVLQNTPRERLVLPGLSVESFTVAGETAKFDLALFVSEQGEQFGGGWTYSADLFDESTIAALSQRFATLLSNLAAHPDTRLRAIDTTTHDQKGQDTMEQHEREDANRRRLRAIRPKAVSLPEGGVIATDTLEGRSPLPLVIRPAGQDIDLADWANANQAFVDARLHKHGGVLFRGFGIKTVAHFERAAASICPDLFGEYGDLPRLTTGGRTYESTPYPPDQAILFHNESSHLHCWPMRIFFFCVTPAAVGGATPIVDCRAVLRHLDPALVARFREKGLMYVRHFVDGLDVSWRDFFHTTDRSAVEAWCRSAGIACEWRGDVLVTRAIRDAVTVHPVTGEEIFFNQLQLHHPSCLEAAARTSLMSLLGEQSMPRQVRYGDGSPIEDAVVDEVRAVYEELAIDVSWQQGDMVALDNMLVAHGRRPFAGARKIAVALGNLIEDAAHSGAKADVH